MTDTLQKKIKSFMMPLLLGLIVFLLYFSSLSFGFIWDDFTYILNSPIMSDPLGLVKIWTTHSTADFWPLSYSVLWALKQLFGAAPFGYHLANLTLYATSVVLTYKLFQTLRFKSAGWIALLFGLHPMNVEVAVWVFQIKTNLANVFGLAACLCWIQYVNRMTEGNSAKKTHRIFYLLALLLLALSFLAKISLVMLPVLFLLYYHFKNTNVPASKLILHCSPFFLMSFIFGITNICWDQGSFPTVTSELILEESTLFRIALNGQTFLFYFLQTFWPHQLTLVHPRFKLDLNSFGTFIPSFFVLAIIAYGLLKTFQKKITNLKIQLSVGLTVAFILLLPVLGFFEIYFMRYSYVAEHWLTVALLGFLAPFSEYLAKSKLNSKVVGALFMLIGAAFSILSYRHLQNFSSEKILLNQNLVLNPESILAYNRLGLVLKADGDLQAARIFINKAIAVKPTAQSYHNLGRIDLEQSKFNEAKENFEKAIQLNPFFADTYNNLAIIYIGMQLYQQAINQLHQALRIEPKNAFALYNLGFSFEKMNLRTEALSYYKMALALEPSNTTIQQAVFELQK